MRARLATRDDIDAWLALRAVLWPDTVEADHVREIEHMLANADRFATFVCETPQGAVAGFAEAAIRHDYVNGCDTSPVAFVEGVMVDPAHRRMGAATALIVALGDWALAKGLTEMASDADFANIVSHALHGRLGFQETERVVYFRKRLR